MNVLFITADQWRAECLSCHGHMVQTPNLDALAADGVLFERHFANAVPCGPSRASIHTGLYLMNHRSGTNGTPLDHRHDNWAAIMREHGRDPVLFGYTDTSPDPRRHEPDDPVLRTYEGLLPGIRPVVDMGSDPGPWAQWLKQQGYEVPDPIVRLYVNRPDGPEYEHGGEVPLPLLMRAEEHDTWFMVDSVMDFIRESTAPWTVHLSLMRPHPPWVAPAPYNRMYPPADVPGFVRRDAPPHEAASHPYLDYQLAQPRWQAPTDEDHLRRLKASYYGLMSEVDSNLGRLFAFLKETGAWDETLIVFTSDHGEQMGDHWLLGKCGFFDASYHIPLIVRDPRAAVAGRRVSAFTENVDIMPTLLDLAGLPVPHQVNGRSLKPWLDGGEPDAWRDYAFWEYDFRDPVSGTSMQHLDLPIDECCLSVVRTETHKYVHFAGLPPLLFDLADDPGEFVDRSADPAHQGTVVELAQRMLSHKQRNLDQTLTNLALTESGVVRYA